MELKRISLAGTLCLLVPAAAVIGQPSDMGTTFTYQGQLKDTGGPISDTCDMAFGLYDEPSNGNQLATTQSLGGVEVDSGLFTVQLDFGEEYNGQARWLEMAVCCPAGSCTLETLTPRTELTPTPHAVRAMGGVGPPNSLNVDSATGNIGIGTDIPTGPLEILTLDQPTALRVTTRNAAPAPWTNHAIHARAEGEDGGQWAITAEAFINAVANANGAGVSGRADARHDTDPTLGTSKAMGGEFLAYADSWGMGIKSRGETTHRTAFGLWAMGWVDPDVADDVGYSPSGITTIGVLGSTAGPEDQPFGVDDAAYGRAETAYGVVGIGDADATGTSYGVYATTIGEAQTAYGVYATADPDATTSWAGYFDGRGYFSGDVGIGTETPSEQLDVEGNIHASGTIASGSSITINGTANTITSSGDLDLRAAYGAGRVFIDSTGDVGIGTPVPSSKLDVSGDVEIWGDVGIGISSPFGKLHVVGASGDSTVILPYDSISADETLEEPGIASRATGTGPPLSGLMTDIGPTVSITVPGSGYVVVEAKCYTVLQGTTASNYALFQIDTAPGGVQTTPYYTQAGAFGFASSGPSYYPVYVTRVYNVAAGSYTYRLEGMHMSGGTAYAYNPILTATYYPTNYGTVATASASSGGDSPITARPADATVAPLEGQPALEVDEADILAGRIDDLVRQNSELKDRLAALENLIQRADTNNEGGDR